MEEKIDRISDNRISKIIWRMKLYIIGQGFFAFIVSLMIGLAGNNFWGYFFVVCILFSIPLIPTFIFNNKKVKELRNKNFKISEGIFKKNLLRLNKSPYNHFHFDGEFKKYCDVLKEYKKISGKKVRVVHTIKSRIIVDIEII